MAGSSLKLSFSLAFTLLLMNCFSQGTNVHFHFRGLENKKIIMGYYEGVKQYVMDSLKLDKDGEASWKLSSRLQEGLYFIILPGSRYFDLLISESQDFFLSADTIDLVGKMSISPECESSHYLKYQKEAKKLQLVYDKLERKLKFELPDSIRQIRQKMREINNLLENLKDSLILRYQGSLTSKILKLIRNPNTSISASAAGSFREQYLKAVSIYIDAIDLKDERLLRSPYVANRLESYFNRLLVQRNDSLIAAIKHLMQKASQNQAYTDFFSKWLLENYSRKKFPGSEKTYVFIAREYFLNKENIQQDDIFLTKLREKVSRTESILPGASPVNLELPDSSGKIHSIPEVSQKDIILLFYDSECGPCKYVKSQIIALLNRLDSRNICVYAVNLGTNRKEWLNYIKGTGPEWININGAAKKDYFSDHYMFEFLPSLLLIGPDKKITAGNLNFSEVETILRSKYSFTNRRD
jgi:hypothetical protein